MGRMGSRGRERGRQNTRGGEEGEDNVGGLEALKFHVADCNIGSSTKGAPLDVAPGPLFCRQLGTKSRDSDACIDPWVQLFMTIKLHALEGNYPNS